MRFWALEYSLTSIRNQKIRSLGIILLLAFGVALPTTIFSWSATAEYIVFDSYFSENAYQMSFCPRNLSGEGFAELRECEDFMRGQRLTERVDFFTSTIGAVASPLTQYLRSINPSSPNDYNGIQDTRIIPISNDIFEIVSGEFDWVSNPVYSPHGVFVSQVFVEHCKRSLDVIYHIGDTLSLDIFPVKDEYAIRIENLTIANIFDIKSINTIFGRAFPSTMRPNNWTVYPEDLEPVLGIKDSILIPSEIMDHYIVSELDIDGYFEPSSLLRADIDEIINMGSDDFEEHMSCLRTVLLEKYHNFRISSIREIERASAYLEVKLRNQVFTLLGFPIIGMSLFMTIFSSRTSITKREEEIGILRSKGASYNQILTSMMSESILFSVTGLIIGIMLSSIFVPIMGASTGTFAIDYGLFAIYLENYRLPFISILIGAVISFYLPGLYLYHIEVNVQVYEIGPQKTEERASKSEEGRFWKYTIVFCTIICSLFLLPSYIRPTGSAAIFEVLLITLLLFFASYLASHIIQYLVAKISNRAIPMIGEKFEYVSRSLIRRQKQFIPLLIILTLTMTTTTMLLVQSATLDATAEQELLYAYGSDLRMKAKSNSMHYEDFVDELESYDWITEATSVMEVNSRVGSLPLRIEGIQPMEFSAICNIQSDSFGVGNAIDSLERLCDHPDGIIISEYLSELLNHSIGDRISITATIDNTTRTIAFLVLGIMRMSPGFGWASETEADSLSLPNQLGFQILPGGFAFVNQDYILRKLHVTYSRYFFANAIIDPALTSFCNALQERYDLEVDTYHYCTVIQEDMDISLFLRGMKGFTTIAIIICTSMSIIAIGLFFGSAISERKPEYAILRAVGATKHQIRVIVLGEFTGVILAMVFLSIGIGFSFGYLTSILIFAISPFQTLLPIVQEYQVSLILFIALSETMIMLLACLYPAHKAQRTEIVEVLRNL
ncbi:MAG: FtsX-like permease family protein [Candidatus Thorarchaeota archaeon]